MFAIIARHIYCISLIGYNTCCDFIVIYNKALMNRHAKSRGCANINVTFVDTDPAKKTILKLFSYLRQTYW